MIANPFNAVDNHLNAVLTGLPDNTLLYKWDEVADTFFQANIYGQCCGWSDPNMTLAPGEGALILATSTTTATFKGEVLQGFLVNSVPSGLSIRASKFPKADVISSLGFPIANGDTITRIIGGSYTDYNYHNGIWTTSQGAPTSPPTIGIGESFWINKHTDWKQHISIWP